MSEEIRQRILKAAAECFKHQGYIGTTVAEICQSAGVAPATFYRYFHSKRDLFDAAGIPDSATGDSPRRREILEAALKVFSQKSYHGATMTEIAARAGVARATLYSQFATKKALLRELLQENPMNELVHQLNAHVASRAGQYPEADPRRNLEFLALQFLRFFRDERRVALLRLIVGEGISHPPLQRAYHRMVSTGANAFSKFLSAMIPELEDPLFTARVFIGGLLTFVLSQQVMPGTPLPLPTPEDIAQRVAALFFSGILPEHREEAMLSPGIASS